MAIALVVPVVLLNGPHSVTAFTPAQLHALAVAALELHIPIYSIALAFFGCYDLLIGYLSFRSTFLPRLIGALMIIRVMQIKPAVWHGQRSDGHSND
jgi:hypothetical protein